jgi:HAD superfamily hydrolase (TIGR01509 family)
LTALIFDCDGTLADNERYGHLPAFNQAFREFGLPVQWSEEEYGRLLGIAGGKERMASLLSPEFVRAAGLPAGRDAQLAEVARWHKRKTEIYVEMVSEGRMPPRAGVCRLIVEALDAGWTVAVASTAAGASVRAILDCVIGSELAARFSLVLDGERVPKKKPAPDIYIVALQRLGIDPAEALVIEDSRTGLLAAVAAGIRCVVATSSFTQDDDFSEAVLVVTSLGDPGGERTRVTANRGRAHPGDFVTLRDLQECLAP